jgi:hypothetical protein
MNALFLAIISLFAVASSVQGAQWSSDVSMQINKEEGAHQAPACSELALIALKTEVGQWLQDELIDLFGEDAFTLGQVTSAEVGSTISLIASVDCIDCSKVANKGVAQILMFYMQHMMDEWIDENNAGVLAGCMGEDTIVSDVSVGGKKVRAAVI